MNLLRQPCRFLAARYLFSRPQTFAFSEFFRQKDLQDMWQYNDRKVLNPKYRGLIALWKRPLQKKRLRQARIKQIKQSLPEPKPDSQKLVVHTPALGIKTPTADTTFAVVQVDNRQFKVTKDCMIILDTKPEHQINKQIDFSQVLLLGTDTYTSLGRPFIQSVKVKGVIESISMSQKVLVFKKKRRKQYKKSYGSKVPLTTVRITSIVHNLTQQLLSKAVALQ